MKVRIKSSPTSLQALYDAAIPREVIKEIAGNVVEIDATNHIESDAWIDTLLKWEVPTECIEPIAA